jgi:S-DNA-T family DNA segregation ATPase FtsK/SpoIIIE
MSAVVDMWGWRARFRLGRGQTIDDVRARLAAIESGLGVFRGAARVYPTPDGLAHRFELRVLSADPHAGAITWPGPSVASITEPVDLGPFEDATPARVLFLRRHALLGGVSGSGKSGGLNVLMGNLTACTDVVIWAIDLKRGMELGPWASCIARLATTPAEARALLADAVAVLEARAASLAASGLRTWQPSAERPALVILVDEYAELADDAPDAAACADSIARRGRAVAVTLIAATQRPTQKAMGQGALRSQMDIRISFRVRERKDVELILGQGMLAAGWHAHTLNAPGKFLVSAPEHDTPRRARCYLVIDEAVTETAARHAGLRPMLDEISSQAIAGRAQAHPDEPVSPAGTQHGDSDGSAPADDRDAPDVILWAALSLALPDGTTVPELMAETGMSRPWIYQRLASLSQRGQVTQVSRGHWRAAPARDP